MKKYLAILSLAILVLFSSCDLLGKYETPELYLISVGLSYNRSNGNPLQNTQNDEEAMRQLFTGLADQAGMTWHSLSLRDNELSNGKMEMRLTRRDSSKGHRSDQPGLQNRLPENYYTLVSDDVLRAIEKGFRDNMPKPNDLLVFYYAGHGFDYTGSLWVAPYVGPYIHGKQENPDAFLKLSDLMSVMGTFNCRTLILLDSCFSGAVLDPDRNTIIGGDIDGMGGMGNGGIYDDNYLPPGYTKSTAAESAPRTMLSINFAPAAGIIAGAGDATNSGEEQNKNTADKENREEKPYMPIPSMFIITAATSQQTADDGKGDVHSPFMRSIIRAIQPNYEIGDNVHCRSSKITVGDLYKQMLKDFKYMEQDPQAILTRYDLVLFDFR